MYCIDELLNWQYEHPDHKQATKRNVAPRICIYFKKSRGNRLLIHGELCQRTLKQDVLKLMLTHNRRAKHSLWLNKRYIWNSKTKIVNRSTQQRYRKFYRQNKSLSTAVQLSRPCWTDSITCVRKLDNIVWNDASWDIWNSPLYPSEKIWLWRSVRTTVLTPTTCKPMPNVWLFWRERVWPTASCEAETTKESVKTKTESGKCFCIKTEKKRK